MRITKILIVMSRYIAILVFSFMLVLVVTEFRTRVNAQNYSSPSIQLALVEQRENQIDRHLEAIDKNIDSHEQRISQLQSDLSQIRGVGIGIGALIGLFQLIQVILQLRVRKGV